MRDGGPRTKLRRAFRALERHRRLALFKEGEIAFTRRSPAVRAPLPTATQEIRCQEAAHTSSAHRA